MFSYGIALESKRTEKNTYFGKYPAKVVDTSDPDRRGRVRVSCPSIYNTGTSDWAEGCFPPGYFYTPPVGSYVWVEFFQGDPEKPIWVGQFYPKGTVPTATPLARKGDQVTVDTATGVGSITQASSKVLITE